MCKKRDFRKALNGHLDYLIKIKLFWRGITNKMKDSKINFMYFESL